MVLSSFSKIGKINKYFKGEFKKLTLQAVDAELEKDAKGLAERDGWILKQNFIKYALGTDLCKDDPSQERVFSGKV